MRLLKFGQFDLGQSRIGRCALSVFACLLVSVLVSGGVGVVFTVGAGFMCGQCGFLLDRPKFRSSAANFVLPSLSGSLLVEMWPRFRDMDHPKCAFGFLWGHFVRAVDPKEPQGPLWVDPGLKPRPQFHEKTSREKRKNEICGGRGDKSAKVSAPHPFGPPPSGFASTPLWLPFVMFVIFVFLGLGGFVGVLATVAEVDQLLNWPKVEIGRSRNTKLAEVNSGRSRVRLVMLANGCGVLFDAEGHEKASHWNAWVCVWRLQVGAGSRDLQQIGLQRWTVSPMSVHSPNSE